MVPSFSIYLDLVRFLAAFLVFVWHVGERSDASIPAAQFGHECVIVFFVLSGYVISFVAAGKEKTLKAYTLARVVRIYSVAFPALVLTLLLDWGGYMLNPGVYANHENWDYPLIRLAGSLLFTNQLWFLSIESFTNGPYWSLNYEVWYYAGFAFLTYIGGKKGWLLFLATALFVGPKIIVLMPIWWAGVYIHRSRVLNGLSPTAGWALIATSLAGIVGYYFFSLGAVGYHINDSLMAKGFPLPMVYSRQFVTDHLFAVLVCAHFVGIRAACRARPAFFNSVEKPVRSLAGLTFSLYLLHYPFLFFFEALFSRPVQTPGRMTLIVVSALAATLLCGYAIEKKRHVWKKWAHQASDAIGKLAPRKAAHEEV